MVQKRKLIEVSLPLEAINTEAAREKARKVGKPQHIHHWWARRPITAARAILFAQLVDDPSSDPERFGSPEEQREERERLHGILRRLAEWEALKDRALLREARAEIERATGGSLPTMLDPFAGGGAIPLEAQRLGLPVVASDLNPVAVLINKALVEYPPLFGDCPPVFPGLAESRIGRWSGPSGLAADVRAYGDWLRDEAIVRLEHLYPPSIEGPVLAWIWARTVVCPNPACGMEMPLVRSWWLSRKRGREAYVVPSVQHDPRLQRHRVEFTVGHARSSAPSASEDGTVGRKGAVCVSCRGAVDLRYIRAEGQAGRIGQVLMAMVVEGQGRRIYLSPTHEQSTAALVEMPHDVPDAVLPPQAPSFRVQAYGMRRWSDLFTNRQLVALTTFSDLVRESRDKLLADGADPRYADAVVTYLGLAVSRLADWSGNLCRWEPNGQVSQQVFGQQSVNMTWDFSEARTTSERSSGSFGACLTNVVRALEQLDGETRGTAEQADAASRDYHGTLINTDPPYYDNIGYSDLSDYFYVWLRRSLGAVHRDLFGTLLVPKAEELVANQYRHGGPAGARLYFERGFRKVFERARSVATDQYPVVVYYAFKQSEADGSGEASTGWETLLEGMVSSGWGITSTWPMRTEMGSRLIGQDTNALASSIVLSLRPRPGNAPTTDRRGLIAALQAELPDALRTLQQGGIAPVDLPQAAIGPGMAVFSRYSKVVEADGSPMSVHSALARINEILDQVLNEQEGDFDPATRFAIAWYRQHGYTTGDFGDADNLARARNTSVAAMDRDQILTSRAGKVTLIRPADTAPGYDVATDEHTSAWEVLHHLIRLAQTEGVDKAGGLLAQAAARPDGAVDPDLVKELAFLLFSIAEKNGWTADALAFNTLATSWTDIAGAARNLPAATEPTQAAFDFSDDE